MGIPFRQAVQIGAYVLRQHLARPASAIRWC